MELSQWTSERCVLEDELPPPKKCAISSTVSDFHPQNRKKNHCSTTLEDSFSMAGGPSPFGEGWDHEILEASFGDSTVESGAQSPKNLEFRVGFFPLLGGFEQWEKPWDCCFWAKTVGKLWANQFWSMFSPLHIHPASHGEAAHTAVVLGQSASNTRTVLGQIVEKTAKHHPKRFKNSTPIPSKTTQNYISIYLKTLQSEPIFHLNTLFDRNTQKSAKKYEHTSSGRVRWTSNSTPIPSKTTQNSISIYLKTLQNDPIFHLNTLLDRNTQKLAKKYENTSSGRARWTSNSTPMTSKTTQNSISIYLKTLQNDPIFHLNTLLDRNTQKSAKKYENTSSGRARCEIF